MLFDTSEAEAKRFMAQGIRNNAAIFEGDVIPVCETAGMCLSNKWGVSAAVEIPVGVWVATGKPHEYEVEFVPVCADYQCRLPVNWETKKYIDNLLGSTVKDLKQALAEVDALLEGS